ncbi:MAG: hypothetical protein ACTSRT_13760 [Promethearchaeota archaeon]
MLDVRIIKLKDPNLRNIRLRFRQILLKESKRRLIEWLEKRGELQNEQAAQILSYEGIRFER